MVKAPTKKEVALRADIRRLLGALPRSPADFDAFCVDRYPDIKQRYFTSGMTRVQMINILFEQLEDLHKLDASVREYFQRQQEGSDIRWTGTKIYHLIIFVLLFSFIISVFILIYIPHRGQPDSDPQIIHRPTLDLDFFGTPDMAKLPTAPPPPDGPDPPPRPTGNLIVYSSNHQEVMTVVWIEVPGRKPQPTVNGPSSFELASARFSNLREGLHEIRCFYKGHRAGKRVYAEIHAGKTSAIQCFPP